MTQQQNYDKIFQLKPNKVYTQEEIKTIFRKLTKRYHPDFGGDTVQMQFLNEAYNFYKNYFSKNIYTGYEPTDYESNFHNYENNYDKSNNSYSNHNKDHSNTDSILEVLNIILSWNIKYMKIELLFTEDYDYLRLSGNPTYELRHTLKEMGFYFQKSEKYYQYKATRVEW